MGANPAVDPGRGVALVLVNAPTSWVRSFVALLSARGSSRLSNRASFAAKVAHSAVLLVATDDGKLVDGIIFRAENAVDCFQRSAETRSKSREFCRMVEKYNAVLLSCSEM